MQEKLQSSWASQSRLRRALEIANHGSRIRTSGSLIIDIGQVFIVFKELKEKYNELETASEASDDDLDFFNDEFDFDRMVFFNNHDAQEIWERYGFF